MIVWRGIGGLAAVMGLLAVAVFGLGYRSIPGEVMPFVVAGALLVAGAGTWFLGFWINQSRPRAKIEAWATERRAQLDYMVAGGQFSLGPGQPQPSSIAEAEQMSQQLMAAELERTRGAYNQHTLFWVPMQYWGFVYAAIAVVLIVVGIVGLAG